MTRREVMALRDSCMASILAAMPKNSGEPSATQTDLDFVAFLTMVHTACCKQLDSTVECFEHDEAQKKCLDLSKALAQANDALLQCHGSDKVGAVRVVLAEVQAALLDLAGE